MTRQEFDDWYEAHADHFPGVRSWLEKLDYHARGVLTVWYQHLKSCEVSDCITASRRLYEAGGRAPVYERHPQAVKTIVHDIELERAVVASEPTFVDGEQVFQCLLCEDDGRLICWSQKSMNAARDGTLGEPFTDYASTVACTCVAGKHHRWLQRYDPAIMLIYRRITPTKQARQELIEFVNRDRRQRECQT